MFNLLRKKFQMNHRNSEIILAAAVIFILLLLIIPMNDFALDGLITASILISILTLLVTLYSEETLAFNSFPSFLLFLTLFRLGLNIATTRMILTEAHAGYIIKTFGEVVTGGNAFVGFVIFILLTGINFIVITKGSGRVAEVAARFTLDSLPGKQLAIDADVNAGLLDEQEAKKERDKIMTEADFYGAMDGASKFVRGDALAGIVIILVNTFGGFVVGMAMKGMQWDQVVKVYMTLTVGDGLVTQIPALLVSVAAGILVTKSSSKENLAESFRKQLFNNPKVLNITAVTILLLSLVPGMPKIVMFLISGILFLYARALKKETVHFLQEESQKSNENEKRLEEVEKILFVDPMEIELGSQLTPLATNEQGGYLLNRISLIRKQIASELGVVVPSIRIRDNQNLKPDSYTIKIKGNEVAQGILHLNYLLAMNPHHSNHKIKGIQALDPAFGLPSIWIEPKDREVAVQNGYILADPMTVLATHLIEVVRSHANELLNRQEVSKLIENAKEYAPAVIAELIPVKLSFGQILHVLQNLLRERVSIRDMVTILETLADCSSSTGDLDLLTEHVRQKLARTLSKQYAGEDKVIHAILLDPRVEQMLQESIEKSDLGKSIIVNPVTANKILQQTQSWMLEGRRAGIDPIVITTPSLRPHFKRLIERKLPRIPVLSMSEIVSDMKIKTLGIVSTDVLAL